VSPSAGQAADAITLLGHAEEHVVSNAARSTVGPLDVATRNASASARSVRMVGRLVRREQLVSDKEIEHRLSVD
jgi:hypothetical protein